MKVSELKHGVMYRPTRRQRGLPNTYMMLLVMPRVRALARRLGKRGRSLSTADERTRIAALSAIEGDGVVLEVFTRYTSSEGERVETKRYLGLEFYDIDGHPREVALRAVKTAPGYSWVKQEE
jgi:hypothetical protein